MNKGFLVKRLTRAHPGWVEWDDLVALVSSLDFEYVTDQYMGNFFVSDSRLTFSDDQFKSVRWLPSYVGALRGMKAAYWEMAGGYADAFDGRPAVKGSAFSPAGNDEQLGYPLLEVPKGLYPFQSTYSGALFFINKELNILFPSVEHNRFEVLDRLEEFSRKNIKQAIRALAWSEAYSLHSDLLD